MTEISELPEKYFNAAIIKILQWATMNMLETNEKIEIPKEIKNPKQEGFPGGSVVKNPPANAGDTGLIPGPGRSHMPRSN